MLRRFITGIWSTPWLLMFLTTLSWASNVLVSRIAVGEITPMLMGGVRWPLAALVVLPFVWRPLLQTWPVICNRWFYLLLMGGVGFTGYSALFYVAGAYTTGVNFSILLAVTPVFTVTVAAIVYRVRIPLIFLLGLALTLTGALLIATHGDLTQISTIKFNPGDILIVTAALTYAFFTAALRWRPALHPLVFFIALCIAATIVAVPLIYSEWALGKFFWPSAKGWWVLIYSVGFPTILAQLLYIRSVELIGPQRTGLFYNLVPILGALLSVIVLHEPFALYHGIALLLVLGGISIAETFRAKT